MLPRFWRNQCSSILNGMALLWPCLLTYSNVLAQTAPLSTPNTIDYPGVIQTFEKLIQVDSTKFQNRFDTLIKNGKTFSDTATSLELDADFLNSIILHSNAGYLRLASTSKCRFYDAILTDLLRSAEGKIRNVLVGYTDKDGKKQAAVISKKDFLAKVVSAECPETTSLINQFQIKNLDQTLNSTLFEIPTGKDHCRNIHLNWLNNPKTPYLCQIHEYMTEAKNGEGDLKDLQQRQAMTRVLDQKLNLIQKDYIENLCAHLDHEELFCNEFLSVSFWSKIAGGYKENIYAQDICANTFGTETVSGPQLKQCLARLKKENDLCLYGSGRNSSLSPHMECDALSIALNRSALRSDYQDCPGSSDQLAATNLSRMLLNISNNSIGEVGGPCSAISAGETMGFNQSFDNEESWTLEACYDDKINDKEVCTKTFFGKYGNNPFSYTNVVANILKNVRGADSSLTCTMLDSQDYNPLLLQYKSGCYIIYERNNCFISQCKHKILFNDRTIDFVKIKNRLNIEYFPLSVRTERFSQHFLFTRDFKQKGRSLNNLTSITSFFKSGKKNTVYGVGCAEDLLPSFFKANALNQCSPLPFIIDGMVKEGEKVAFVTHTSADSLQAPRLVSWSNIYSGVKAYQRQHPLKIWTLYGLD